MDRRNRPLAPGLQRQLGVLQQLPHTAAGHLRGVHDAAGPRLGQSWSHPPPGQRLLDPRVMAVVGHRAVAQELQPVT
eukprot:10068949-Lingulodinium_polyedra.AAC.1